VPAYNEARFVAGVVRGLPVWVDAIVVVDDCSTDGTGDAARACGDPRVTVLCTPGNLGVGGATLLGWRHALDAGADVVVKMDGDGQMSPAYLPALLDALFDRDADYAKGNRFMDGEVAARMPPGRLVGNVALTFLTKLASGYWNVFDPQNGYVAVRARALRQLPLARLHRRFFFENDMLIHLNVRDCRVVDVPMPPIYGEEESDLSIPSVASTFPVLLVRGFFHRVMQKYVLRDVSPIALFLFLGLVGLGFGTIFGGYLWLKAFMTRVPTPTGSIVLVLLSLVLGFQLVLQAIVLDIQQTPR
jgi:glycosyltransferase involved in cell wall biosynthesis